LKSKLWSDSLLTVQRGPSLVCSLREGVERRLARVRRYLPREKRGAYDEICGIIETTATGSVHSAIVIITKGTIGRNDLLLVRPRRNFGIIANDSDELWILERQGILDIFNKNVSFDCALEKCIFRLVPDANNALVWGGDGPHANARAWNLLRLVKEVPRCHDSTTTH
jgi:hypothetical protein